MSDDLVSWAYRLLLGREPEPGAVENNPHKSDPVALLKEVAGSPEFKARISGAHSMAAVDLVDPSNIEREDLRNYAITGYKNIEGWGIDDFLVRIFLTLDQFQKTQSIHGNVFELGVYRGKVTILLGLMAQETERIIALDVFETLEDRNIDRSGIGARRALFEKNMGMYGLLPRTDIIVGDSMFLDFSKYPSLDGVRFAHIDGGHYVDCIVNDLMKTQRIMSPGGIIVVDDFNHNLFTGANEGCHRFLSCACPRLAVPFAVGNNKLFLTTHSHHAAAVAHLRGATGRPITNSTASMPSR